MRGSWPPGMNGRGRRRPTGPGRTATPSTMRRSTGPAALGYAAARRKAAAGNARIRKKRKMLSMVDDTVQRYWRIERSEGIVRAVSAVCSK